MFFPRSSQKGKGHTRLKSPDKDSLQARVQMCPPWYVGLRGLTGRRSKIGRLKVEKTTKEASQVKAMVLFEDLTQNRHMYLFQQINAGAKSWWAANITICKDLLSHTDLISSEHTDHCTVLANLWNLSFQNGLKGEIGTE